MTASAKLHAIGLARLTATLLAATVPAVPALAQIGGVGSAGAPGAPGAGGPNISGAGTGFSSPNATPGVQPLTGNAAGAPGLVAPAAPAPAFQTPGFGPGVPGAAGTQPVTGVPNAATTPPEVVAPRPRPH